MAEELAAFERTGTWEVVPLPSHVRPITCKWIYTMKTRSDGSLERYKARLVARGFQQEYGRDYDETFAHVAHMTTIRTLLVVASVREWSISQLDVKNSFLNGDRAENRGLHETTTRIFYPRRHGHSPSSLPLPEFSEIYICPMDQTCGLGYMSCHLLLHIHIIR
ncbi:unnamed protein product [Rhodiola kirilowii]